MATISLNIQQPEGSLPNLCKYGGTGEEFKKEVDDG